MATKAGVMWFVDENVAFFFLNNAALVITTVAVMKLC